MKITGKSTVEHIESDDNDYERTGCGTWTIRMGESMEPVYDAADLEREYQEVTASLLDVPNCQGLLDSSAFQRLQDAANEVIRVYRSPVGNLHRRMDFTEVVKQLIDLLESR